MTEPAFVCVCVCVCVRATPTAKMECILLLASSTPSKPNNPLRTYMILLAEIQI